MYLPQDPVMLLSVINTALRDRYPTLEALCEDADLSATDLAERLSELGVSYDRQANQFK